jgi:hypothetical protein
MRIWSAFALLLFSLPAMAGGFYVELGNPSASKDAAAKNAFAVARLIGCHQPERGSVTATAEGMVNGQRKSVPVKVIPLSTPGMFALAQNWPAEGKWVLHVAANHPEITGSTTTLVRVKGNSYDRASAKMVMRPATKAEIEAFLE